MLPAKFTQSFKTQLLKNLNATIHTTKIAVSSGFGLTKRVVILAMLSSVIINAQSISISNFYYRDYLDLGQGKGAFSYNGSITLTGKDGSQVIIPQAPNFQASSNYGSLTSVGRGFTVTANHVSSPDSAEGLLKFGLTNYAISTQTVGGGDNTVGGTSKSYGSDTKFIRLNKYVVEGQVGMLDVENTISKVDPPKSETGQNITKFKEQLKELEDSSGSVYLYQAGSGIVTLRNTDSPKTFNTNSSGEMKGGGFGTLIKDSQTYNTVEGSSTAGIQFFYAPNSDFNNRITSGDSGSGIYAYDSKNNKWILLGVTSMEWGNRAMVSVASNKDLEDYRKNFEQKIQLNNGTNWVLEKPTGQQLQIKNGTEKTIESNKDIIFSGGGSVEVKSNVDLAQSGYAGGFVFEAGNSSENPTKYTFKNENGTTHYFKGSGLDIGENVEVEWHLRNASDDALHKVGKGTLIVKTDYETSKSITQNSNAKSENLGYLKIGEGKVVLDTSKKAYEGIYITSGRGSLELKSGKAEALGAVKNSTDSQDSATDSTKTSQEQPSAQLSQNAIESVESTQDSKANNSYTLSQNKNSDMGFYFGTGGGRLDLGGNSLQLNTIAANDSKAIIANTASEKSTLQIEGFGYDSDGTKQNSKADTIIHASIGEVKSDFAKKSESDSAKTTQGAESHKDSTKANIDIIYNGDSSQKDSTKAQDSTPQSTATPESTKENATLIFDGNINTSGKMEVKNGTVALQGHATTHAVVSDEKIQAQIKDAESKTQQGMPDYMDLSKPSTLNQPDWDNRSFTFGSGGISLDSATLTLGRNASLSSDIDAKNNSSIKFGSGVKHFIDNKDGSNINGSGFGYYQKVESGLLDNKNLADETISYTGKITSDGGSVESSIIDFNASLDLKNNATLKADYLTLTSSSSVKLDNTASASVGTLRLNGVSDLNNITLGSETSEAKSDSSKTPSFKVEKGFWFDNSTFDLTKLDSKITKNDSYDIIGVKSSITGTDKSLSGNVSLYDSASLSVKNIALKGADSSADSTKIVYLQGDSTQENHTKLTLSENLTAENLNKAEIILDGKSEISTKGIEFSGVKDGLLFLDKDAKLSNGDNNAKVDVKGKDSSVTIAVSGDKSFNINGESESKIALVGIKDDSAKISTKDSAENETSFKGDISLKNSSEFKTSLESITAKVELSDSAKFYADKITLQDAYNAITLKGTSSLTANSITAKNLTALTLSAESGTSAKISHFIFDGGQISSGLSTLLGDNITLKNNANITLGEAQNKNTSDSTQNNAISLSGKNIILQSAESQSSAESSTESSEKTTLKATNLNFNGNQDSTITLDKDSKLDIDTLSVDKANLKLYLADSSTNAQNLKNIDVKNGGNVIFSNSWDFGNATNFKGDESSRVIFGNVNFNANNAKTTRIVTSDTKTALKVISANTTIHGTLSLESVGATSQSQATTLTQNPNSENRFYMLDFDNKNLNFGESSKISVSLDSSVKKGDSNLTLGTYYTLISAGSVSDDRADKRIDFNFDTSLTDGQKLFVVSKFMDNKLLVKFLESDPKTYSELNKHIDSKYSKYLGVLIEHNNNDDSIDIAAKTDDYSVLTKRLQEIDSTMQNIADSNQSNLTHNLLTANNHTIDTRITQVRLASASARKKPLYFAYNDTMQRIFGDVRSDVTPSYSSTESRLNDVWLNVGGGYFGGTQSMGFATTNLGYDRLLKLDSSEVLVGGMLGFGVTSGSIDGVNGFSENASFYNVGLYTHSLFGAGSGIFGGHELQGNFSVSVYNNARKYTQSQSATNLAAGILLNLYYKYNFVISSDENSLHSLKPVALVALGFNHNGAFETQSYKQNAYSDTSLGLGLGVEYNFVKNDSFYSIAFMAQDRLFNTNKSVAVSMSNATSFIGYTLNNSPKVDFSLNFTGSHYITEGFYVQYGVMGLLDTDINYGIKGDIKIGYRF